MTLNHNNSGLTQKEQLNMIENTDEDLMKLRNEALKTMGKKTNTTVPTVATTGQTRSQNSEYRSSVSDTKPRSAVFVANSRTNHNTSHNSGHGCTRSNRSNLIVLTQNDEPVPQPMTFTRLMDRPNESPAKQKKVLPGRFNRRDSDDSDEESEDDISDERLSDDNNASDDQINSDVKAGTQAVCRDNTSNTSTAQSPVGPRQQRPTGPKKKKKTGRR